MSDANAKPETALVPAGDVVQTLTPGVPHHMQRKWRLAGDVVARATEQLDPYEKDQLRWLHRYATERDMPPDAVGALLEKEDGEPYSGNSLYQALTGRRQESSLRPLADSIAAFRRRTGETEAASAAAFVMTPLARRMFEVFSRAARRRRLSFIFGPPQIGKTTAAAEYARRNNHGSTILVRMPARGALCHFLPELGGRLGIPRNRRESDLRRRIIESFDEGVLLIVDEAHQPLLPETASAAMALEFIREIHDRRKCGVVLMGTDVLKTGLQHNKLLSQLWRRRSPGSVIQLPHTVPDRDLNEFAASFGLEPAPDKEMAVEYLATDDGAESRRTFRANPAQIQRSITTHDSLGSWLKLLEDAQDLARERRTALRWSHVLVTWCLARAVEEGGVQ